MTTKRIWDRMKLDYYLGTEWQETIIFENGKMVRRERYTRSNDKQRGRERHMLLTRGKHTQRAKKSR